MWNPKTLVLVGVLAAAACAPKMLNTERAFAVPKAVGVYRTSLLRGAQHVVLATLVKKERDDQYEERFGRLLRKIRGERELNIYHAELLVDSVAFGDARSGKKLHIWFKALDKDSTPSLGRYGVWITHYHGLVPKGRCIDVCPSADYVPVIEGDDYIRPPEEWPMIRAAVDSLARGV